MHIIPIADRIYRGAIISRAMPNASGIKWQSYCCGQNLRADTLAGIKGLIGAAIAQH